MSNVPIVQGTVVAQPKQQQAPGGYASAPLDEEGQYGYQQATAIPVNEESSGSTTGLVATERGYRDVVWALLFVGHLIAMLVVIGFGLSNVSLSGGSVYGQILIMVTISAVVALVLSTMTLKFMMDNTQTLVQTALIFSVCSSLAIGIVGFMVGSLFTGIVGIVSFAIGCCYAKIVWPRIPFAASNLHTALTAVRANLGLAVIAYMLAAVAFAWTCVWFLGVGESLEGSNLAIVFVLFLSYYWVHQVLQNTMHVTTAGVIATWWFVPDEASSWWSSALTDSWFRATTYSFGSICLGSLLVATVQALRALEYYSRDNDDLAFLSCIIQCILSCLEAILEEITKFAYVYVGLYGFSFLEAGRNVIQLFQQKGWTVIITDDLADNVMFMMSVAVGLATGLVGMIMGVLDANMFAQLGLHAAGGGFMIGFLTGFLISTVLLSIVGSAVNTVIVCYAEAPNEFERNHPQLSQQMRSSWAQAWPSLFN